MRKGIETNILFWIIVFLIGLVIVILLALWFLGYGKDVINILPGLIPGIFLGKKGRGKKGLSPNMDTVWFILLVFFFIIVLLISATLFGWAG